MTDKFLHTICCSSCGRILCKSYEGTQTFIRCPKCKTELFYEVQENGPKITIMKRTEKLPHIPPALA